MSRQSGTFNRCANIYCRLKLGSHNAAPPEDVDHGSVATDLLWVLGLVHTGRVRLYHRP
jgi:hypothetical protein